MLGISWKLIVMLCSRDLFPEFLMEFIKVDCEFSGMSRYKVTFWMYRDVQMVAFVGEEWRDSSNGTWSVVVGKLC